MTPAQFRAIRHRLRLTQAQLAERLGLATYTVQRYESGARRIPQPTALLMIDWGSIHGWPGTGLRHWGDRK